MKYLISMVLIAIFFFSCQSPNNNQGEVEELSTKRKDAAEMVLYSSGATEAKWESPEILVLLFSQEKLNEYLTNHREIDNKDKTIEQTTKDMAIGNAIIVRKLTEQKTCVKIMNEDGQELAFECKE